MLTQGVTLGVAGVVGSQVQGNLRGAWLNLLNLDYRSLRLFSESTGELKVMRTSESLS